MAIWQIGGSQIIVATSLRLMMGSVLMTFDFLTQQEWTLIIDRAVKIKKGNNNGSYFFHIFLTKKQRISNNKKNVASP